MPTYNFTSDLRIASLPERLKSAANEILSNELSSDKSASNNRATLAFYFNLVEGSNTLKLAANGSITEVVRNFVLKFQFPNTYTADLFNKNKEEGLLIAPLRECVKLLAHQYLVNKETQPYLTYDEIRYYVFATPYRWISANSQTYSDVIQEILSNRQNSTDYTSLIESELSWKQYERQSREMISIIPYACDAFITKKGMLILEMPSPLSENFADCLHFLASILKDNTYWDCSNLDYNILTKDSYAEYMDINGDIELCRQSTPRNTFQLSNTMKLPLQIIYFGAPGTGKSHRIKQECKVHEHFRITFHPDTDYASFVGAYKPTVRPVKLRDVTGKVIKEDGNDVTEEKIIYSFVKQAFLKAYIAAWLEQQNDEPKPVFLIIEEINRGNCAQIFGDIFQLLDRNESGFSDYPIIADTDIEKELSKEFKNLDIANAENINSIYEDDVVSMVKSGSRLLLPNNLYIWATMNTSDQSLFPIDSAFKRRWEWKYVKIADSGLNYRIAVNDNEYDWWEFVKAINAKIGSDTDQEDKKLGYFFAKAKKNADGNFIISADTLLSKVLFFIYNDVYKDFGLEDAIFLNEDGETMNFADYFDEVGDTVHDKVERFLLNLGLEPLTDEQAEEAQDEAEIEEDKNDDDSSNKLTIRFPNGTVVKEPTRFESFKKALEIIGLDKVEPIAAEKKYMRRNSALVSTSESPEILADPVYTYVKSGDYYIVKGTNTRTQRNLLNLISDRLNLGLKVTVE